MANDADANVALHQLTSWALAPQTLDPRRTRRLGPFAVLTPSESESDGIGRWHTVLAYQDQWLLYVDEFRDDRKSQFALTITGNLSYGGNALRWQATDGGQTFGIHMLGDYAVHRDDQSLTLGLSVRRGRFIVAWTRDPTALVRPLAGWAVEIRCAEQTFLVLHANGTAQKRLLGPLITDARYAVVERPEDDEAKAVGRFLEASRIRWEPRGELTASPPIDLAWGPTT